jgi:hypothetical protein
MFPDRDNRAVEPQSGVGGAWNGEVLCPRDPVCKKRCGSPLRRRYLNLHQPLPHHHNLLWCCSGSRRLQSDKEG